MYAIQNKRTKKFVTGTDKRSTIRSGENWIHRQFTSHHQALTYEWLHMAEFDMKLRRCGKVYRIVKVKLEVVGG